MLEKNPGKLGVDNRWMDRQTGTMIPVYQPNFVAWGVVVVIV
jgi:hypothetical protein